MHLLLPLLLAACGGPNAGLDAASFSDFRARKALFVEHESDYGFYSFRSSIRCNGGAGLLVLEDDELDCQVFANAAENGLLWQRVQGRAYYFLLCYVYDDEEQVPLEPWIGLYGSDGVERIEGPGAARSQRWLAAWRLEDGRATELDQGLSPVLLDLVELDPGTVYAAFTDGAEGWPIEAERCAQHPELPDPGSAFREPD